MALTPSSGGAFLPKNANTIRQVVTTLAVNGPIPTLSTGIIRLTKATAAAVLLRNPLASEEGNVVTFTAGSAAAHVITGSFQDGVTGGAKTTATFAAFIGASMTLMAVNRQWYVQSLNAVTIT